MCESICSPAAPACSAHSNPAVSPLLLWERESERMNECVRERDRQRERDVERERKRKRESKKQPVK